MRKGSVARKQYGGLILSVAVSLVFLGTLAAGLVGNYRKTRAQALARADEILLDSAAEQAKTLYGTLEGHYTVLEVLAAGFGMEETLEPERILPYLAGAESETPFLHIILDLPDGSAFVSNGRTTNVADRRYFQQSMLGARSIEYVRNALIEGTPLIILSVPIRQGDKTIGVIHGSYEETGIKWLLTSEVYGGQGSSFVCDDRGNIIISSEDEATTDMYESFASVLEKGASQSEARRVMADLADGKQGKAVYSDGAELRYAVYVPLDISPTDARRWYIVNGVPEAVVNRHVSAYTSSSLTTLLLVIAMALLAIGFFVWREAYNRRQLKRELAELAMREEQYRIVAKQSNKNIYRYDIKTHVSIRDRGDDDGFGKPQRIEDVPESILDLYAEESREEYREFFRKIRSGVPTVSVVSRMRDVHGNWRWVHSDATVIFSPGGEPTQAVVSYYDVTEQREKELLYQKWLQDAASISMSTASVIESNLTQDVTEREDGSLLPRLDCPKDIGFNKRVLFRAQSVASEDRAAFIAVANRERLIGAFYDGVRTHSLDYRLMQDADFRWVNMTIQLAQYPDTNELKAFIVVKDIDEQKREELSTQALAETDRMTTALNRMTFIERAGTILLREHEANHALMILDVDNLKQINDSLGHQAGDQVLTTLVRELRRTLRDQDLIGRIGGDEFMILLRNVSGASAAARAEAICQRLLRQLTGGVCMSVSLGVSLYPRDGDSFAELYKKADTALYRVKNQGRNGYALYYECEDLTDA